MDLTTRYQYKALKPRHIRVLYLQPLGKQADGSDELQGHLEDISLDSGKKFDSLSYVWGSNETPYRILIHGSPIPITASCYTALRNLRRHHGVRTLWVDSISINQIDNVEKAAQIPLMRDIYGKAQKVYVWLGESTLTANSPYGSDYAMEWLRDISANRDIMGHLMDMRHSWIVNPLKIHRLFWLFAETVLESE